MSQVTEVANGLRFPEGPIALENGDVLVVEIERGTLSRVSPDGVLQVVAECGGGPNGAAVGPDGAVYVCNNGGFAWHEDGGMLFSLGKAADYKGGSIQRVELDTGRVHELYTSAGDVKLRGPNDIVFDSAGGFYFTDFGQAEDRHIDFGTVYYAAADGSSIEQVAYPLFTPNGVGLSPAQDMLYVAETLTGRVWQWHIESPGKLRQAAAGFAAAGGAELLCGLPGYQLFDSLAVDGDGNVCVGTLVNSGISVIAPTGELIEFEAIAGDALITNICFGGADRSTAYVTASSTGKLLRLDWPRPGLELAFQA
jgi:gluconolactonase